MPAHRQGDQDRHHEDAGGHEDPAKFERQEEHKKRPEIEQKTADLRIHAGPIRACAKAWASKGCKSASPSPTPMKCTGSPNRAASATRMPPLAVPSSLVMISPDKG